MKPNSKLSCVREPWQIAAARYCVNNSEKGFTDDDLRKYIKSLYKVNEAYLTQFLNEEIFSPAGRQYARNQVENKWIPPLNLVSKITNYDELQEARKNAKHAFWLSLIAIIISAIALLVSIFK
ncbi:MAG: hypothetical protein HY764_03200 [Candidatus Portnoybacteria bacterium]|nr:hypothetical protein [Candidatus Portnoybacteria bacterium]